ncbi:hypothetical protein ACHAQJ_010451 [Trichoderma viride]
MGMFLVSRLNQTTMLYRMKAILINRGGEALNRMGSVRGLGVAIIWAQILRNITIAPATSVPNATEVSGFAKESSVSEALAFGGGLIPEKDVRIFIQPVHRSKWMKRYPQQQSRKLPPLPIAHQRPTRSDSPSPNKNFTHSQTTAPGPSLTSSHTPTPELDRLEIPSRSTSASNLPLASQNVAQRIASPITEPTCNTNSEDLSILMQDSTPGHDQVAVEELRVHFELKLASPRAVTSIEIDKTKKERISQSKSPSEETLGEKNVNCDIGTPSSDNSMCYSPKKAPVALSSTPIKSSGPSRKASKASLSSSVHTATGDGSPTSKSYKKKGRESPAIAEKDCQHPSTSVIENDAREDGSNDSMPASSDLKKAQDPAGKSVEKSSIVITTYSEKQAESASMNSHARIPSPYTEEEIKERKQAWNRIPMPLDPRKSKKLGTTVISGQPAMPQIRSKFSGNTTGETGVSIPFIREKVQLESSDVPGLDNIIPEQSTERAGVSVKDEIQQLVEDEVLNSEQRPDAPPQLPLRSIKTELPTNRTTKQDPYSSKMKVLKLYQPAPIALVQETGIAVSQAPASADESKEANNVASNQSKPKSKWGKKNNKNKKRLASASQSVLQKDGSSQEISPSASETSTMLLKEGPQMDHHMLTLVPTMSESLPIPVHFTGKLDESAAEPFKDSKGQAVADVRGQYHYDTLPRGQPDFRNNAGGSLKIPKKRKNKYPAITSKTFEASTTDRFEPPQPGYAASSQIPMRNTIGASRLDSVTHATEPDPSKRSRLNPLATAFESPRKAAAATVDVGTIPNSHKAASSRTGPGEGSLGDNRSPSKFKSMQRSATAHNSPTKAPQPRERFVRRTDGSKVDGGYEISTRQQENNPVEIQRGWSKDKHRHEGESKESANLKATSPGKKAALDKEDWPSLPASRVRSATLQ